MNHKITLWAVCAAFAATVTGCNCCQATDSGTTPAKENSAVRKTHHKKAVTPEGEVIWIVAEWDACCTPCSGKEVKTCKNAKCWKTRNGKVLCVKPIRKCPNGGKNCQAAEHYKSKAHHCVMCTQDTPAAMPADGQCGFAAKEITECPANGGSACKAREHVNLPDGKKGCAKADQATPPQAGMPVEMDDSIESNEVFEITASN